jgi:hypothetical protein
LISDSCLQFHTNIKYIHFKKQDFYYSPPLLSFSILSLLLYFSFIHLSAVFASYFSPFPSLPLSFRRMFSIASLSSRHLLHLLSSPSVPSLNLAIIFLSHTLSPLPIVLRFSYSLSSILVIRVFVPLPFYSPSLCTFSRRVVFFFSLSSRIFSSVSPLYHPI